MEKSPLIDALRTEDSYTENGALTNSTSLSNVLDLFFLAGASRNIDEEDIRKLIIKAMAENKLLTLKVIFWAGNIRGGAGERRFFKIALETLEKFYREDLLLNINLVPEFNRWDSLFPLVHVPEVLNFLVAELKKENPNGLLCKWLPRQDYSKKYGSLSKKIRTELGLTGKEYRNLLVKNTKVVESKMCKKEWNSIEYKKVPSKAMHNYIKAFYRHDEKRFDKYLDDAREGKEKINSKVLFPHEIIGNAVIASTYDGDSNLITKADVLQWENLPNYLEGAKCRMLPVCDVSGSMSCGKGLPLKVSVSLGIYISERNEGPFKDCFITFSEKPELVYLKGTLKEKVYSMLQDNWGLSTNIEGVFKVVLEKAVKNNIAEEYMPEIILIISDMEFNDAIDRYDGLEPEQQPVTNYTAMKRLYKEHGYNLPNIVFWNVNGRIGNVPVTMENDKVALVSGFSPSILKSIFSGEITPIKVMLNTIDNACYKKVRVFNGN